MLDDEGQRRGHHRVGTQRGAPDHRGVHAARQRDGRGAPRAAAACRRSTGSTRCPIRRRCEEFEAFIARLGYSLGVARRRRAAADFQRLVEKIAGTPVEKPIAFLMLRTMQQARYDAHERGPLRPGGARPTRTSRRRSGGIRTCVVHRLLRESRRGAGAGRRRETLAATLPEIARHTSQRERRAMDAERELVQWKKVRFMADKVGDEFDGYVTGVSAFGLFIELVEHFVEGLVHVSTMADDFYRFLERPTCCAARTLAAGVSARRPRARAGAARRHRATADRSRPGGCSIDAMRTGRVAPRAAQPAGEARVRAAAAHRRASRQGKHVAARRDDP